MECKAIQSDEITSRGRIDWKQIKDWTLWNTSEIGRKSIECSQKPNNMIINHVKCNRPSEMKTANWPLGLANADLDKSVSLKLQKQKPDWNGFKNERGNESRQYRQVFQVVLFPTSKQLFHITCCFAWTSASASQLVSLLLPNQPKQSCQTDQIKINISSCDTSAQNSPGTFHLIQSKSQNPYNSL